MSCKNTPRTQTQQSETIRNDITKKPVNYDTTKVNTYSSETSESEDTKIIKPPANIPSRLAIPQQQYSLKAEQGAVIKHQNGTTIHIPPSALCYKDGKSVKGQVDISFREMHDALDIAASSVSMLLDTFNHNPRYLETVGMMEIHALQKGEKLYLKPNTYIEVRMPFSSMHSDYKVYNFDYTQNRWRLATPQEGYIEEMHKDTVKKYYSKIEDEIIEETEPQTSNFYFQLEIDVDQYPELKKYKSIAWVFAGKNKNQSVEHNQWVLKRAWNDVKLTPQNDGTYKMVFIGYDNTTFTTIVKPKEKKEVTKTKKIKRYLETKVVRNYHWIIHQFGLWNCGRIYDNKNAIYILSNFVFNKPCKQKTTVYFIDAQNRVVIDYVNPTEKQNRLISLDENGKFVALTEDHKLFLGKIQKVERNKIKTLHSYTFTMHWSADSITSISDIRKHLYADLHSP
ncbi:MAG: hypothetical protein NZ455_00275 [Bacteroidia bacterium]|nr:hypothetical protein [Bacteroidia bacterium]MDW8347345.1 hypothetical protein [Bacteroidia bacterium]